MTKKLLHKTQKAYLIYSIITFLIVSPIFYFVTKKLSLNDADESLQLNKELFNNKLLLNFKIKDIAVWNTYNPENKILASKSIQKDSIFSQFIYNKLEEENEPFRILYAPITIENKSFLYTEKISLVESEDLLISIVLLFIILISLLLVGLLVITNILSRKIWKPFYQLINQIESFEIDKDALPQFTPTNIEEFNRLNISVEKLISKNIVIYENQREFIDNAAHELQTPLAIFKVKLDVLIQRQDVTEGQSEIIESINYNINRLIKLNKNLLILSKIDRHLQLEKEDFSLKKLLEKRMPFFTEQASSKNITLTFKATEDIIVKGNKSLVETMLSNLLLNAIQHNTENGTITVKMNREKLMISNTSLYAEISKEKLFNRFNKSNENQLGNGLGLAIVKKIVTLHNWEISYSFTKMKHTFTIHFLN